jgi:hypothetical protein
MTLEPITLEEYFHLINKKPTEPKETNTMFGKTVEAFKAKWNEWVSPVQAAPDPECAEATDYWQFTMFTDSWVKDGEIVPEKFDHIGASSDETWMGILDQILDVMSKHYSYDIKEQVYYSIKYPLNKHDFAGYGRSLNDDVLQQLLLAHPEVYEMSEAK